jgi:hypothetical protein
MGHDIGVDLGVDEDIPAVRRAPVGVVQEGGTVPMRGVLGEHEEDIPVVDEAALEGGVGGDRAKGAFSPDAKVTKSVLAEGHPGA